RAAARTHRSRRRSDRSESDRNPRQGSPARRNDRASHDLTRTIRVMRIAPAWFGVVIGLGSQVAHADSSDGPPVWVDFGLTALRYTPDKIDTSASDYHLATTRADQPVSAAGWRFRFLVEIGDGWYAGGESDLSYFDGPQLTATSVDGAVARTIMPVTSRGE